MSATELREKLIAKIRQTKDEALLEDISNLIELQETDQIYLLSNEQKKAVEEARKQIKNGACCTDEQANKEIDQWLSE